MASEQQQAIPFAASLPSVTITTDGGCSPNPGPGAWAYTLRFGSSYKEGSGRSSGGTTNNRMELQAVVEGLRALKKPCRVLIRTDSKNTIAWCGPKAFKGRKKIKFPEAYALALEFRKLGAIHTVSFLWVKGHTGDIDNERCDELCAQAMSSFLPGAVSQPKP